MVIIKLVGEGAGVSESSQDKQLCFHRVIKTCREVIWKSVFHFETSIIKESQPLSGCVSCRVSLSSIVF